MNIDQQKIDDTVLALLQLTTFTDGPITRAWKGQDWDVMDRLYEKGLIFDPKGKAKSIVFTDEGLKQSEKLFEKLFATGG